MRRFRPLLLIAVAVVAAACLSADPFVPRIEEVTFDPSLGVDLSASTKTASGLYYRDITVGDGIQVSPDTGKDTVFVRYRGWLRNAVPFDSNTLALNPLRFVAGQREVIDGFDEGVRGMRVNGVRQLIIPPALGYGASGAGSNIPPNSILVFNVTLTRVGKPATP